MIFSQLRTGSWGTPQITMGGDTQGHSNFGLMHTKHVEAFTVIQFACTGESNVIWTQMTPKERQWNGWNGRLWSIVGALSKPITGNDPTTQGFMGIRRWVLTAGVLLLGKPHITKWTDYNLCWEYGLLEGKQSYIEMLSYRFYLPTTIFPSAFPPAAKSSKLAGWQITKTVAAFFYQTARGNKEPQEEAKSQTESPFCVFTLSKEPLRLGHLSEGQFSHTTTPAESLFCSLQLTVLLSYTEIQRWRLKTPERCYFFLF